MRILFFLLLTVSFSATGKTFECTQIAKFSTKLGGAILLEKNEKRASLVFIQGDRSYITMQNDNKTIDMSLGLIGFGENTSNIQSKGAMTTFRTYNLEKPLIVRVVDSVFAGKDRLIVIDIGTDDFMKKYNDYQMRFACFDN